MAAHTAGDLLVDPRATLHLVDSVLGQLQGMEAEVSRSEEEAGQLSTHVARAQTGIADLPQMLLRAYREIQLVLETLKQSRSVLERTTVERLHSTNDKLREVTSATEVAATDILDGLDRALALVDRLDDEQDGTESGAEVRADLRNEIFGVMGCLQFQDITSQQLSYASSVLDDMETRLATLAQIFDPRALGAEPPAEHLAATTPPATFDPAATTQNAEGRQALADQIFQVAPENA